MALETKIKFAISDGALVRKTVFTVVSKGPIRAIKKVAHDLYDRGLFSVRGNMSARCDNGFIITASGANFNSLSDEDFVQVNHFNIAKNSLEDASGLKNPSSETPMHALIYETRKDANAIIHTHDPQLMSEKAIAKLKFLVTPNKTEPGTPECAQEIADLLENSDVAISKAHGLVIIGKSIEACQEALVTLKRRAP